MRAGLRGQEHLDTDLPVLDRLMIFEKIIVGDGLLDVPTLSAQRWSLIVWAWISASISILLFLR
jgi:hypothetical protein